MRKKATDMDNDDAIQLWNHEGAFLIVLDEDGALYSNQVGGTACGHPVACGILVPIRIQGDPHALNDYYNMRMCDVRELAQEDLDRMGVSSFLSLRDTGRADVSEAWIPVTIGSGMDWFVGIPKSLWGRDAILTYPNSD